MDTITCVLPDSVTAMVMEVSHHVDLIHQLLVAIVIILVLAFILKD